MTRITEAQTARNALADIYRNRSDVDRYSQEVSSGIKVRFPGDSNAAGTISLMRDSLLRLEGYGNRVANVKSSLTFQDDVLSQAGDILIRAKEIAAQATNETNGTTARAHIAEEVFQIRNHLVTLANSKFQGKYIFGGADDDDPPFDEATYTNPGAGEASRRFVYDAEAGTDVTRTVNLTDDVSVTINTPGNTIFADALFALERLGRSLAGYRTDPDVGTPDGTGTAYTFPDDYHEQTDDIAIALDLIETARNQDILPQRVSLGGKLRRIETAESLIDLTKINSEEVLSRLQNADPVESASALAQAQTVLQASFTATSRILQLSILDYL